MEVTSGRGNTFFAGERASNYSVLLSAAEWDDVFDALTWMMISHFKSDSVRAEKYDALRKKIRAETSS